MDLFSSLAGVLGLAALGGIAAKALKQPVILGYLIVGIFISGWQNKELLGLMGQLGATLLLFLVGLELPMAQMKKIGRAALATGFGQIVITTVLGYVMAKVLGFQPVAAMYVGVALTFSSTIIIVKLLSEKGDLQSLHGKIALGSLLVQDFVAIGILVMLSAFAHGGANWYGVAIVVVKGVVLIGGTVWLADKLLPKIAEWLSKSTEILFIASIGWCLVLAAAVASKWIGFNVEIGGLLAGMALANAVETLQISARVRPLRDFFMVMFFVSLGADVRIAELGQLMVPTIVFTIYVLVGNPLVMMAIMGLLGYKKRTAFMAGITMAQISEFSLIVVATAVKLGQVGPEILSLITLVGITTMTAGSYLIMNADKIYRKWGRYIPYWQRGRAKDIDIDVPMTDHIVLLGHNRIGAAIRPTLEKLGKPLLIVDFNPEVVEKLLNDGVKAVYGDVADTEIYDTLGLRKACLIVSTISDCRDAELILAEVKSARPGPVTILTAGDKQEAAELYKRGADLVIIPHEAGGEYLAGIFEHYGLNREAIEKKGAAHLGKLHKL